MAVDVARCTSHPQSSKPTAYRLSGEFDLSLLGLAIGCRSRPQEHARMPARALYRQFTFSLPAPDSLQTAHVVGCSSFRLPKNGISDCVICSKIACSTFTDGSCVAEPTWSPLHRRYSIFWH